MDKLIVKQKEIIENRLKDLDIQIQQQTKQEMLEFEKKLEEDKNKIDSINNASKPSKLKKFLVYGLASLFPLFMIVTGTISLITAPENLFLWIFCYAFGMGLETSVFVGGKILNKQEQKEFEDLKKSVETRQYHESSYLLDLKIKYYKAELKLRALNRKLSQADEAKATVSVEENLTI